MSIAKIDTIKKGKIGLMRTDATKINTSQFYFTTHNVFIFFINTYDIFSFFLIKKKLINFINY